MLVSDILRKKGSAVLMVAPDTAVADAVAVLAEKCIGAVVVSADGRRIDGILSERDIVRTLAAGVRDMEGRTVADLMTADVIPCTPQTSIDEVMAIMDERYIRHVPVAQNGEIAGLVSVRDVVSARIQETEREHRQMRSYIAGGLNQVA